MLPQPKTPKLRFRPLALGMSFPPPADSFTLSLAFKSPQTRRNRSNNPLSLLIAPITQTEREFKLKTDRIHDREHHSSHRRTRREVIDSSRFQFLDKRVEEKYSLLQTRNKKRNEKNQIFAFDVAKKAIELLSGLREKEVIVRLILWEGQKRIEKQFLLSKRKLIYLLVQNNTKIDQSLLQNESTDALVAKVVNWYRLLRSNTVLVQVEEEDKLLSYYTSIIRSQFTDSNFKDQLLNEHKDSDFKADRNRPNVALITSSSDKGVIAKLLQTFCFQDIRENFTNNLIDDRVRTKMNITINSPRQMDKHEPSFCFDMKQSSETIKSNHNSALLSEKLISLIGSSENIKKWSKVDAQKSSLDVQADSSIKKNSKTNSGFPFEQSRIRLSIISSKIRNQIAVSKKVEAVNYVDACIDFYKDKRIRDQNFSEMVGNINPDLNGPLKMLTRRSDSFGRSKASVIKMSHRERVHFVKAYMAS